jgi:hypothetical protein
MGRRATGRRAGRRTPVRRSAARRATLAGLALLAGLAIAVAWSSAATARPGAPDRPPSADQPRDCEENPPCPPDREPVPQDPGGDPFSPVPVDSGHEAKCLRTLGGMTDSAWDWVVANARTQAWTMEYMGLSRSMNLEGDGIWDRLLRGAVGSATGGPIQGLSTAMTDAFEDVTIRVPGWVGPETARWYAEEAREEAHQHQNCALARHVPTGNCAQIRSAGANSLRPDDGILPDECWGNYPSSSFDLHYDNGGFFSWDRKIWATMTGLVHVIGKGAIQLVLALIGWAFVTFEMEDYSPIAIVAGGRYHTRLIQRFDEVTQLAWLVLFGFCGVKALRGKLALAGGEIAMSIVALSLATYMMTHRADYLAGAADTIDKASTALLAAGNQGQDPTTATGEDTSYTRAQVIAPLQRTLHEEFVELPFDHIHFGAGRLRGECANRRNQILWVGAHRDGGWAQRYMETGDTVGDSQSPRANCDAYADNMGEPNTVRFLTALVTTVIAVVVAGILGSCALTVIVSKLVMMLMFIILPFALVAAILPGAGRRSAWSMLGTGAQAGVAETGMSGVLSFLLVTLDGVHNILRNLPLAERYGILLPLVLVVFWIRMRLLEGSRSLATNITNALTRASPASRNHAGGEEGINLRHLDGSAARGMVAAGYAGAIGGASTAALGYGVVKGAGRGLVVPQLHRRRDLRNKRYAAENLRDNRNALWRHEQRPKYEFAREVDLSGGGGGLTAAAGPAPLLPGTTPDAHSEPTQPSGRTRGGRHRRPRGRSRVPVGRARRPPRAGRGHATPGPATMHPPPGGPNKVRVTYTAPVPRTPVEQALFNANYATFEGRRGTHYGELVGLEGPKFWAKKERKIRKKIRDRGW